MGREVRMIPADWQHPKDDHGRYIPLLDGSYAERAAEYAEEKAKWERGDFPDYASAESRTTAYEEWSGGAPVEADYMPVFAEGTATHLCMYEDTSEGTPISPAFATAEELARWLTDTGASAFGHMTASYEGWLATCRRGSAISMAITPETGMISGVELNAK